MCFHLFDYGILPCEGGYARSRWIVTPKDSHGFIDNSLLDLAPFDRRQLSEKY